MADQPVSPVMTDQLRRVVRVPMSFSTGCSEAPLPNPDRQSKNAHMSIIWQVGPKPILEATAPAHDRQEAVLRLYAEGALQEPFGRGRDQARRRDAIVAAIDLKTGPSGAPV